MSVFDNVNCYNNIYISNLSQFENNINCININAISNTLNINSDNITIGNVNSTININGTTTYVAVNEVRVIDKVISLNFSLELIIPGSGFIFVYAKIC